MIDERTQERLSAWIDGELEPAEAGALETRLAADPELAAEAERLRAVGGVMRRGAAAWDRDVSFDDFYERVAARLPAAPPREVPAWARLRDRLLAWTQGPHRPALAAAAATLLVLVGGGSLYLLQATDARPSLRLSAAPAQIEDLSIENASAVVYRTQQNVTVIWLTEDEGI